MQLAIAIISVFYMFIYIVSELTSISNIYALMIGKSTVRATWCPQFLQLFNLQITVCRK